MKDFDPKRGYTTVANDVLDLFSNGDLSPAESKVLAVLTRLTTGFHVVDVRLSYRELSDNTGIDRTSVIRAINSLIKRDVVLKDESGSGRGAKNRYSINHDSSGWSVTYHQVKSRSENFIGSRKLHKGGTDDTLFEGKGGADATRKGGVSDTRNGGADATLYCSQTLTTTGPAAAERKEKKRKRKNTTCSTRARSDFYYLSTSQEVRSRGHMSAVEADWQIKEYLERSCKRKRGFADDFQDDILALLEGTEPKTVLLAIHDAVPAVVKDSTRLVSEGLNPHSNPVKAAIATAANRLMADAAKKSEERNASQQRVHHEEARVRRDLEGKFGQVDPTVWDRGRKLAEALARDDPTSRRANALWPGALRDSQCPDEAFNLLKERANQQFASAGDECDC